MPPLSGPWGANVVVLGYAVQYDRDRSARACKNSLPYLRCGAISCVVSARRIFVAQAGRAENSVLLRQHDRDYALGDRGIGRIWGVVAARLVQVIDLEEQLVPVDLE